MAIDLFQSLLSIGIVGGFALYVYSKFRKISMKEAIAEIQEKFEFGGNKEQNDGRL